MVRYLTAWEWLSINYLSPNSSKMRAITRPESSGGWFQGCKQEKLGYLCFCCTDFVQFICVILPQEQCGSRVVPVGQSTDFNIPKKYWMDCYNILYRHLLLPRNNPYDLGDLSFPVAPSAVWHVWFWVRWLLDGFSWESVQTFVCPSEWIVITLAIF